MATITKTFVEMFLAACLGMAVVVIPVALDPNVKQHHAAFAPVIGDAVEGIKPYSFLLLVIVGRFLVILDGGILGLWEWQR